MDARVNEHLLNICSSLGGFENTGDSDTEARYVLGDECLDCLRDLKRYLRFDDQSDEKPVLRIIGESGVLTRDLLPIFLLTCRGTTEDEELICAACLELLVPMTWPLEPQAPHRAQRLRLLWEYKLAFLGPNVLSSLFTVLTRWLSQDYRERSPRQHALIRLLITLVRNLLAIQDPHVSHDASAEMMRFSGMHDALVCELHHIKMVQLLLVMASSIAQQEFAAWSMLLLEIIYHLYAHTNPAQLLHPEEHRDNALRSALQSEQMERKRRRQHEPTRHSRFGGALDECLADGTRYTLLRQFTPNLSFHETTNQAKKPKTQRGHRLQFRPEYRPISPKRAAYLRETANTYLKSCFNPMLANLRRTIEAESGDILEADVNRFFWHIHFFLEYFLMLNESTSDALAFEYIAEALDLRTVLCIVKRIQRCHDARLHTMMIYPVSAFHQTLCVIRALVQSSSETYHQIGQMLQSNIFYEKAILDLAVQICYYHPSQPPEYQIELVTMLHVFLKMVEHYTKQQSVVFVRQRRRRFRKRKRTRREEETDELQDGDHDEMEEDDDEEEEEDEERAHAISERNSERAFEFQRFQMGFAKEATVNLYCYLLDQITHLDVKVVGYIASMLHRLFVNCKAEWLFYKLSILQMFDRVLDRLDVLPSHPNYQAVQEFIIRCIRRFTKVWQRHPLLAVEVFFPKSRFDRWYTDGPPVAKQHQIPTEISNHTEQLTEENMVQSTSPTLLQDSAHQVQTVTDMEESEDDAIWDGRPFA